MKCTNCGSEMRSEIEYVNDPEDNEDKPVVQRECPDCGSTRRRGYMSLAEAKRSL